MTHTYTPAELRKMVADATPGPWSVPGQPDKVCAEGYTANGWAKVIVTVQDKAWMPPVECFANAHLMAQSPTIALALADALEEVARLREHLDRITRERDAACKAADGYKADFHKALDEQDTIRGRT